MDIPPEFALENHPVLQNPLLFLPIIAAVILPIILIRAALKSDLSKAIKQGAPFVFFLCSIAIPYIERAQGEVKATAPPLAQGLLIFIVIFVCALIMSGLFYIITKLYKELEVKNFTTLLYTLWFIIYCMMFIVVLA